MGRPRSPLITRERVIEASLRILRAEGAGALTLRRIGKEVGVNAASIYHHFDGKEEILGVIARTVIEEVEYPDYNGDLRQWLIDISMCHYRFFIANPYLVPLLAQGYLPRVTSSSYQAQLAQMRILGIETRQSDSFFETVETLVLGGSLLASMVSKHRELVGGPPTRSMKARRRPLREIRFESTLALVVDSALDSWGYTQAKV